MTSASERVLIQSRGGAGAGRLRSAALAALTLLTLAAVVVRQSQAPRDGVAHEFTGFTMGTTYSVKVAERLDADRRAQVRSLIESRLDRIVGLMSTYDSTSELSRFNHRGQTDAVRMAPELIAVMTLARDVSERSGGAFDVTVAPLVNAWGFGPAQRPAHAPAEAELDELRRRVGYRRVFIDGAEGTVAKAHPAMFVDLSAVAKGFAVDQVADALTGAGLERFLVEVGGELKGRGRRADGSPWRVGVERPDWGRGVYRVVELFDEAIATSGDYRNFYDLDGTRYQHIIDPRTGSPAPAHGISVSVIDEAAARADAWATALVVLGPAEGEEVAIREGVAALFVMRSEGGLREVETPAFAARRAKADAGAR